MIIGYIDGALVIAILAIRFIPFIPLETKIQWITQLGLILMFFTGGAAFVFVKNAIVAVIVGAVVFLVIQALLQTMRPMLGG